MKKLTLNVGCGKRTYKRYPVGFECINMDNRSDLPEVDVVGDVRRICFPDNIFDYVLASDIIEHFTIKETKKLLAEWKRVLKPDGILEIRTPNLKFLAENYMKGLIDINHPYPADFFSYHAFGGQDYPGNFHYVLFDRSWLSMLCKSCGLKEIEYKEVAQNFIMKVKKGEKVVISAEKDNIILRPVYNRPEMFALSLQYEQEAREFYGKTDNLTTLFLIEHGTPKKVLELIEEYPYKKKLEFRPRKFGLTMSILEGMKQAFKMARSFIIYIEDDILIHKTYFHYLKAVFKMSLGKISVISPYNFNDKGDVHEIRKAHHYTALAPLMTKEFFDKYVKQHITPEYYGGAGDEGHDFGCRHHYILKLNEKYKEYWGSKSYKYRDGTHNEQAGLLNRLVDIAMIEENMHVIMPSVNRQQHIGYFGKNRPGGKIPGNNYEERLNNLKEIVKDADKMYELSATKQYNDYLTFSPKLDKWDGTLRLKNG